MGKLEGKVALITGAGRGMGRSHGLLMAKEGAEIIVQDIDSALAEESVAMIRDGGGRARAVVCDVADVAACTAEVAAVEAKLGHIDILVNNAGIDTPGELSEIDETDFERMFAIHVKGSFFMAKAVTPGMKDRGYGKIVNVSSMWGMTGHTSCSHYCGAKAALLGLTKAWAKEFAPCGINVNAIAPGGVITEMVLQKGGMDYVRKAAQRVPMGRYADVVEMSCTVLFLCSSESDFITGQVISPNGGEVIVGI